MSGPRNLIDYLSSTHLNDFPMPHDPTERLDWLCAICMSDLTSTAKAVAGALVHRFNREIGLAWPSIERLALDIGADPRSVQRGLGLLTAQELVVVESGGGRRSNSFRPQWERRPVRSIVPAPAPSSVAAALGSAVTTAAVSAPRAVRSRQPRQRCHPTPGNAATAAPAMVSPQPRQHGHGTPGSHATRTQRSEPGAMNPENLNPAVQVPGDPIPDGVPAIGSVPSPAPTIQPLVTPSGTTESMDEHDLAGDTALIPREPASGTDEDLWRYRVGAESWARQLKSAGAKIGPRNWRSWKGLVDRHGIAPVAGALAAIAPDRRWPDQAELRLTTTRGQETSAVQRKTVVLVR